MNILMTALGSASVLALSAGLTAAVADGHLGEPVTLGIQLEPPMLDPTGGAAAAIDEIVYANIFEGLTRFAPDGSVLPGLAKSWDISDDGLVYTFSLNTGVTYHDGTDFDAEDVKFSLDRARAEDSTNAQKALFEAIESVEVVDPATVKITLSAATGSLLFNLAWGDAVIVAPESVETNATDPVGTGPFKFVKWTKGDSVEIAYNPDYWGEKVHIEGATFKFISDPTAAFAAVMAEDLDAFVTFPAPELREQLEADARFDVIAGSTEGETILSINNKSEPFDDVRVRKAIAHALDREALIEGAVYGLGSPIGTHFAPHHPAYVDLTAQSAHDPEMAKQLLAEAGYPDGFEATLKLPPPDYARRGGEIVAAQLRAVGIELEISNLEWAQWLEQVFRGKDFDLTIVSHTEPMDIGIYGRDDYYFQYVNEDFKAALKTLNETADEAERTRLLQEMQKIIADDYVNGFMFQRDRITVAKKNLKGLWPNAPTQANDLTAVRWE